MILLCDEDVGTGVPHALSDVGYDARSLVRLGLGGASDTDWLRIAGQNGWLVFSHNKKMLVVEHEKRAIIEHHVGIVFLTSGEEKPASQLRMLLNRWPMLELLDATVRRPFARFIRSNGRMTDRFNYRGTWLSIP